MTEPARHLTLVDPATGEVVEQDAETVALLKQQLAELEQELRTKRSQITRLKNENARLMGVEPGREEIIDVLEFACKLLMPRASIVPGSKRWLNVRARLKDLDPRTDKPKFTPLALKAAAAGAALDDWTMDNRHRHRRDPEFVFADAGKVDRHLSRAVGFKHRLGVSALTLIDELGGTALEWLADRCSCGGLFVEHLRSWPTPDGYLPCPDRGCEGFDFFNAKVERALAEGRAA